MSQRMPGFTAEQILPASGAATTYRSANTRRSGPSAGFVPQSIFGRSRLGTPVGQEPCIPGCICVSQDGCPCCDTTTILPRGVLR